MRTDIPQLALNAAYEELGVSGCSYQPPSGDPVTGLALMLVEPDQAIGFEQNVLARETQIRVRSSELTPAEGGRFTLSGRMFKVIGEPEAADILRLEWRCVVAEV